MPGFYLPSENEFDPSTDDFVLPAISRERKYKHFDLPLVDREQAYDFSREDEPHRFLPLLGFTDLTRRYVRNASGGREIKVKERPIRFAGHQDAALADAHLAHPRHDVVEQGAQLFVVPLRIVGDPAQDQHAIVLAGLRLARGHDRRQQQACQAGDTREAGGDHSVVHAVR